MLKSNFQKLINLHILDNTKNEKDLTSQFFYF